MYFWARTDNERREWIEAIQIGLKKRSWSDSFTMIFRAHLNLFSAAVTLKGNTMLNHYHLGAYGQIHQQEWSCCNAANRDAQGCQQAFVQSRLRHQQLSLQVESNRSRTRPSHQYSRSLHDYPVADICTSWHQDRSPSPIFYDAKEAPESEVTNQFLVAHTLPPSKVKEDTTEVMSQTDTTK